MISKQVAAAIGIASVLVTGAFLFHRSKADEALFKPVPVRRAPISVNILSTGMVQPENRVNVESPISGRAEKVLVREGDFVKQGQIMLWMSSVERAALLDAARARGKKELAKWEGLYRPMPIIAPITGTVIQRNIEPGQTFTYSNHLFIIADRLTLQAQVDETDIAQIKRGQRASIVLDAYPDQPIPGRVEQIAYEAKTVNNVTTYGVIVLPYRVPIFMRSGMTASVTFNVATKKAALVIPSEAVKVKNDSFYVLVQAPKPGAPPLERAIRTGLSDGKRLEVLHGLREGETALIPLAPATAKGASPGATQNPFSTLGGRNR